MVFIDWTFDAAGQLCFDLFNLDGLLGTKYTVNGKIQPFLEVRRRKYRFRILDGGPSRAYEFFLSNGQPVIQITNDGNLLSQPLTRKSVRLSVAERADVIVDFSSAKAGNRIYLQNRLEQKDGRGPTWDPAWGGISSWTRSPWTPSTTRRPCSGSTPRGSGSSRAGYS